MMLASTIYDPLAGVFSETKVVVVGNVAVADFITVSLLIGIATLFILFFLLKNIGKAGKTASNIKLPPHIPSKIPILGYAMEFNKDPIEFLRDAHSKYGDIFSFTMVGKTFTYLIDGDASSVMFTASNDEFNAKDVYGKILIPLYGDGVAFAVPNRVWMEQKKIVKGKLNVAAYTEHVPIIEEETEDYIRRWGESGKVELYKSFGELIVFSASRCLHGNEIRGELSEGMARLYDDMDASLNYLAWLFPSWIPFPSFKLRDRAHRTIKTIFHKIINQRRASPGDEDMLQRFIDSSYKNGNRLTNNEISGLCIGLLHAGVHTSNCITSWMGFFLAKHKDVQDRCYEEQKKLCGDVMVPITYKQVSQMEELHRVMQETLRLRGPIMTLIRNARKPVMYKDYTIPPGHQVCVSPPVNSRLKSFWGEDAEEFNPDRWLTQELNGNDKYNYTPFGDGIHRCIGEKFAYMEIKTIWAHLLREYEFELVDGCFPDICLETMIQVPDHGYVQFERRRVVKE